MAKQMSVFNSAKKGVANQDLPARPWAQQVDNFQDLKLKVWHSNTKVNLTLLNCLIDR